MKCFYETRSLWSTGSRFWCNLNLEIISPGSRTLDFTVICRYNYRYAVSAFIRSDERTHGVAVVIPTNHREIPGSTPERYNLQIEITSPSPVSCLTASHFLLAGLPAAAGGWVPVLPTGKFSLLFLKNKKVLLCLGSGRWMIFKTLRTPIPKKSDHESGPSPMRQNELFTWQGAARAIMLFVNNVSCVSVQQGRGGSRYSQRRS